MQNICRICLSRGSFPSIFRIDGLIEIHKKVMSVTRIEIVPNDGLPSAICATCLHRTNQSYKFKQDCETVDRKLREKYSQSHHTELNNTRSSYDVTVSINEVTKCDTIHHNVQSDSHSANYEDLNKQPDSDGDDVQENINSKVLTNNSSITDITQDASCISLDICNNQCAVNKSATTSNNINKMVQSDTHNGHSIKAESISHPDEYIVTKPKTKEIKTKGKLRAQKQQCITCGKIMSSRFCLKLHVRTHTGEKPFTCAYCNKRFSQTNGLKIHQRIHTGEKPMQCGTCGRRFTQAATLAAHVRLHTGETPYTCHLCEMSFHTRGHLHYHLRRHNGEKKFECETCGRAFVARGDLKQHARTHSGDKPYVCCVCGRRLTRASNLARHMLLHDARRPFRCAHCVAAYSQKVHLTRHIKKHHADACS